MRPNQRRCCHAERNGATKTPNLKKYTQKLKALTDRHSWKEMPLNKENDRSVFVTTFVTEAENIKGHFKL